MKANGKLTLDHLYRMIISPALVEVLEVTDAKTILVGGRKAPSMDTARRMLLEYSVKDYLRIMSMSEIK